MRVQIISIPKGPTPLWIRKAMVGLVFTVIEEVDFLQYETLKKESAERLSKSKKEVYFIATKEIIRVLKQKEKENENAIEWFEGVSTDAFIFFKIYCGQSL